MMGAEVIFARGLRGGGFAGGKGQRYCTAGLARVMQRVFDTIDGVRFVL